MFILPFFFIFIIISSLTFTFHVFYYLLLFIWPFSSSYLTYPSLIHISFLVLPFFFYILSPSLLNYLIFYNFPFSHHFSLYFIILSLILPFLLLTYPHFSLPFTTIPSFFPPQATRGSSCHVYAFLGSNLVRSGNFQVLGRAECKS